MKPYDEWIIGEGLESPGRWYVIHATNPIFMAEVCDDSEWEPNGLSWSLPSGQVVCNVQFFNEPPTGQVLDSWMFAISSILDDYDERVLRRTVRDQEEFDREP